MEETPRPNNDRTNLEVAMTLTITLDAELEKRIADEDAMITRMEAFGIDYPTGQPKPEVDADPEISPAVAKIQARYNTARSGFNAAQAVLAYLKLRAKKAGYDTDNINLRKNEYNTAWEICWEEGPYEWPISLTGGHTIYGAEMGYAPSTRGDFNTYAKQFYCECQNHYTLVIVEC